MIDDKDIVNPYSGPNDKPLPKKKLSTKKIKAMLSGLFESKKSINTDLVFRILFNRNNKI